jgi:hypothetical protein
MLISSDVAVGVKSGQTVAGQNPPLSVVSPIGDKMVRRGGRSDVPEAGIARSI